jgi:flagellar biosynthesis anti-sigma factor FlgM
VKIDGYPTDGLSAALEGVRPPTAPAANSAASEGARLTRGDDLRLSADAELMRTAIEQAQGAPPIRQDVVERTKAAMARGEIGNDPQQLADALIDAWLTAAP